MPHLVPICFSGSKRARWDACGQGEENAMAKYDLLREHLMRQTHREFDLTFRQIEDTVMRRAIEEAGVRLLFDQNGSPAGIARRDTTGDLHTDAPSS
jgi:hypothetical protein